MNYRNSSAVACFYESDTQPCHQLHAALRLLITPLGAGGPDLPQFQAPLLQGLIKVLPAISFAQGFFRTQQVPAQCSSPDVPSQQMQDSGEDVQGRGGAFNSSRVDSRSPDKE